MSLSRYARPAFGFLPPSLFAAYGASRFHFAEPELNGFGVTTSTPGLRRSSHVVMCLGLPLRTTKVTTDEATMPLFWSSFQLESTRPASTRRVTSGSSENSTRSVLRPLSTLRDWSPEAP